MHRTRTVALWTVTLVLLAASAARAESVRAGYADSDITPRLRGPIPGYFTARISTGVLDPLRAKVLVLSDRRKTIAIVALDLIGLQAPEAAEIRRSIQKRTGIPAGHVFVHSTHTHTGAETPRRFTTDAATLYPAFPRSDRRRPEPPEPPRAPETSEATALNRFEPRLACDLPGARTWRLVSASPSGRSPRRC